MARNPRAKKPTRYIVTDGQLVLELEVAEEGGFTVTCPYDSGLITQAETLEEAFEMAYDAAETLKAARAQLRRGGKKRTPRRSARSK